MAGLSRGEKLQVIQIVLSALILLFSALNYLG